MTVYTEVIDQIESVGRQYRALTQAERSLQQQCRAILRHLHTHAAVTDHHDDGIHETLVSPVASLASHAGDQSCNVALMKNVPAWLRKPPRGMTAAAWHPERYLLVCSDGKKSAALILYEQTLAFHPCYAPVEKDFTAAVVLLPIWTDWCAPIRGISAYGLGRLLAETGDLWWYPSVAKVWKRFGVGLWEGERQRRKQGMSEVEAKAMAYNPRRRSVLYIAQDNLIKQNKATDGTPGVYRQLYLDRKIVEALKAPDLPKMAWHRRAGRYMVKRFLRDLWRAWRQTMPRPAEIPVMHEAVAWEEARAAAD